MFHNRDTTLPPQITTFPPLVTNMRHLAILQFIVGMSMSMEKHRI